MSNNTPLLFKHVWYATAVCDALLFFFILFFGWLTVDTFFFFHPTPRDTDAVGDRIVSLALFLCSPLFFWVRIYVGDIHVDDDGIGCWVWGRRWRYVRWADVKAVTITIIPAYNQIPPTQTSYCFYTTEKMNFYNSQRHAVMFDDHRPDAEALIAAVDRYIQQYNIKVLDRRGK